MQFNGIQLAAITKAAYAMIAADGRIDDSETRLLVQELRSFGVSQEDAKNFATVGMAMEPTTMLVTLSAMSDEQKKYVCGFLGSLMVVDGNIDDAEMKIWQLTSSLMKCPTMSLHEALEYWQKN